MDADDVRFVTLEDAGTLAGSLAIVGVSTFGDAGSLASTFLISRFSMRLVGAFHSDRFQPAATATRGVMTSPLQVWAAEAACGLDGSCDRLLVVKSDLPLESSKVTPLSIAIARWAARQGVKILVGIESYGSDESHPRMLVGASAPATPLLSALDAVPVDDSIVVGFAAMLAASAGAEGVQAVALFPPRDEPGAEGKAAAAALRAVSRLLPHIDLAGDDVERDLDALGRDLERKVARAISRTGANGASFRGYA